MLRKVDYDYTIWNDGRVHFILGGVAVSERDTDVAFFASDSDIYIKVGEHHFWLVRKENIDGQH
jgi:hypothetical protein